MNELLVVEAEDAACIDRDSPVEPGEGSGLRNNVDSPH